MSDETDSEGTSNGHKRLTLYLSPEHAEFLAVLAYKRGVNRSAAANWLISAVLNEDLSTLSTIVRDFNGRRQF